MIFNLMNKDKPVMKIFVGVENFINTIRVEEVYDENVIPRSLMSNSSLQSFIDSRLVLSHRKNVKQLFEEIGVSATEDILAITNGVSLNDTYWLKTFEDKKKWKNVSPYTNKLNQTIAEYSFDNSRLVAGKRITTSPEFATSGQFPKCWKRVNGVIYLYKAGSSGAANSGNEPFSELLASELADALEITHVKYDYVFYKGKDATRCANMCDENRGLYAAHEFSNELNSYEKILDYCIMDKDKNQIIDMLLLDYLTLNTDRHLGNIGILVNNDTQEFISMAPIYDNNMSFLPYYMEQWDEKIENFIINKDGHITTSLGMEFDELFKMIDCSYVREKIKAIRHFDFKNKTPRTNVAKEVLQRQLSRIK